ncbi:MAG: cation:proton antiporter [Candidatus Hadarchaeales archaeon]
MNEMELSSVLVYLAVVLLAAKLSGELFSRLGQPPVIGELISGMLLGPFVAGQISNALLGTSLFINMYSPAGQALSVFSNIGIILLLFLAGLSVDLDEFKSAGKVSSLIAGGGVLASFMFGFGVAWLAGWGSIEAAFLGAVLTATSVGITVRTLVDLGKLHTRVGTAILEAAVIDDVLGIMVLSILSGIVMGSLSIMGISETIILMAAFIVLVLVLGFRILPRLMRFIGKFQVEEMALALALVVVFVVSALAELVRLAAITGAFLAGIVMSKLPVARSLRDKVTSMGYALFIPIFFTEMGIRMDFGELAGVGLLAGAAIIAAAFLSKIVGCGGGALVGGFSGMDSLRVGVGMIPRAEVALVIAAIGVRSGVVAHGLLSMTVLIVLVTTLASPFLMVRAFRHASGEEGGIGSG